MLIVHYDNIFLNVPNLYHYFITYLNFFNQVMHFCKLDWAILINTNFKPF